MKRLLILMGLIGILTAPLVGAPLSLDLLLQSFDQHSAAVQFGQIDLQKQAITAQSDLKNEHQVQLEMKTQYSYYADRTKLPLALQMLPVQNPFPGTSDLTLKYQYFYVSAQFDHTTPAFRRSDLIVGFDRNLRDFVYSEADYRRDTHAIADKTIRLQGKETRNTAMQELVDGYVVLKNIQIDIAQKKEAVDENNREIRMLRRKLANEDATPFDIDYLNLQIQELMLEIRYLKDSEKNQMQWLFLKAGWSGAVSGNVASDIPDSPLSEIADGSHAASIKMAEKTQQQLAHRYLKEKAAPEIRMGAQYSLENQAWTATGRVVWVLDDPLRDVNLASENIKKLDIEYQDLRASQTLHTAQLRDEYDYLVKKAMLGQRRVALFEKRYLAARQVFENGGMTLLDFDKEKKNYYDAFSVAKKAVNTLNGFKFKIARIY